MAAHTHDGAGPAVEPAKTTPETTANDASSDTAKDSRSPAQIEADLDRTRARLSATLDELSERLTPQDLARRGGRLIKAQFVEPETGRIRRAPVAAAIGGLGATVGALIAVWKLRTRSR